jgi:hypothetical protein
MDITSNFFDKFGRKHLWFDLFQQIIKFSAELNFYNFAENIIKKYGRKSQILGGERPPLPPLNREPCTDPGRIPDARIDKFPSELIRIKPKKLLSTVSLYLFRCLFWMCFDWYNLYNDSLKTIDSLTIIFNSNLNNFFFSEFWSDLAPKKCKLRFWFGPGRFKPKLGPHISSLESELQIQGLLYVLLNTAPKVENDFDIQREVTQFLHVFLTNGSLDFQRMRKSIEPAKT